MVIVFHKIDPTFTVELEPNINDYVEVARVQTIVLEKAFELTNNIESRWTENEDVETELIEARSTSVGDILYYGVYEKWYMVDNIGFKEIKIKE